MERQIAELDYDEFERLLGEIPDATSGHQNSQGFTLANLSNSLKNALVDDSLPSEQPGPICMNSLKRSQSQNKGTLNEDKLPVNKNTQSSIKRLLPEEPCLPDDHFLTSAFVELSFDEAVQAQTATPSFQNHNTGNNGQCPHNSMTFFSSLDSSMMANLSQRSPDNSASRFVKLDEKANWRESSTSFELNVQDLKKQQIGYCQPVENFSASMPLPHGAQNFQFLPNMSLHRGEHTMFSNQQQYFFDNQSRLPFINSQQLSQPYMTWKHVGDEQLYRMHQQYLYLQQCQNQQVEAQNAVQANGSVATRLLVQNLRQPYNKMPFSHHQELSNHEAQWNKATLPKLINRSNPILPLTDVNIVQVLENVGKQSSTGKIFTRSHGWNSARSVRFGSFPGPELLANVNQNERLLSKSNFHQNLLRPSGIQLDFVGSRCLSADIADLNAVNEFAGRVYLMAKDQHGCRFLQRKFTEGSQEDTRKIFLEVIVHIVELMTDPFGNYLVQKLLEVCNEGQRMQILHSITRNPGDLVRISCDMHGTRAVQKVIETLKTPEQFSMVVSSLKPGIVTLIKDMNGNHVAQRCLQYLTPEYSEFLYEAATANCVELATDRHGCCVLQKCLSHSDGEQRHHLISEITSNALVLSQDPFGNYVVQFIFDVNIPWATVNILDQLDGNYGDLSMQKYSSNVVEKCLKYAEGCRARIVEELMNCPHLDQIMQDPYGNYVIQAALNHSKGALHAALVEAIRPHIPVLQTSPYGKKVLSSISMKI